MASVTIVSLIRLQSLRTIDLTSPDLSWNITNAVMWTAIECNTAVTCACLPLLMPVVHRCFPCLKSRKSSTQHPTTVRQQRSGDLTDEGNFVLLCENSESEVVLELASTKR
jgi:hypothetical protein